jgi:hypothetical protein
MPIMLNDEPIQVTLQVVDVLEKIGVDYVIGGSLASALHGIGRATMDAKTQRKGNSNFIVHPSPLCYSMN